jgi:voltage-gated potassium channel Kch
MSYPSLLSVWVINAASFAIIYLLLDHLAPEHGVVETFVQNHGPISWYNSLYFSVVTGTTLGYGDIVPIGASRFFAALQSLISFVLLAATVSKIASEKTEIAIRDVEALSREVHSLLTKKGE